MELRAIIIDDEKSARQTLQKLINKFSDDVVIVAEAASIIGGIEAIQKNKVDVVFLDIKMSMGTGFDILQNIDKIDFEVIFTTAYNQYALKAIKFSALDYLLKPINPDELIIAIEKVRKRKSQSSEVYLQSIKSFNEQINNPEKQMGRITLSTAKGLVMLELKDIIRCEGYKNYTTFHLLNSDQIVVSKTLKEYESLLSSNGFIRIFQSHLVNISHIKKYLKGLKTQVEMFDGSILPVSREKKNELLERLK